MQQHRRLWPQIASSEITPEHVYRSRRAFLKLAGVSLGAGALAACGAEAATQPQPNTAASATSPTSALPYGVGTLDEPGDAAFWNTANAGEYGFYGNVNPDVSHPRWSQSSERRIGDMARRRTLKFNGYERSVAALYTNLDLAANY